MTPEERGERAELLGTLARRAREGDRACLERLLASLHDDIYRLALRMTGTIPDAEDATQEILLKVVTRLSSWRDEARITTWTHRITVNHLLDRQRSAVERHNITFDEFAEDLAHGLHDPSAEETAFPDDAINEVRLGCTMAMLQCLDRDHRIAYILGELFDIPNEDAAWISNITNDAHRKRLSRARERVRTFMANNCGLVNTDAQCHCRRRTRTAIALGRINPDQPALTRHPTSRNGELLRVADIIDALRDHVTVLRDHPDYATPRHIAQAMAGLLDGSPLLGPTEV